ncbi:MAG: phenylalanine--tRNA ligase subunit beta [Candidatus Hodarchaeaceae archaeon]|nr:phenylalanine--tRNA ligase subunit beta [Candidatus Hodarchaeaceae archaeon]
MPAITVSYRDLCGLLGKRIKLEPLKRSLLMMGIEAEATGDDLRLEVAHNRPDLLSAEGVARALKGFLGIEVGLPFYGLRSSGIVMRVDPSTRAVRPYAVGGVVEGVRLTDAAVAQLMQVQDKLHETLGRNRRRVAIGIHDLDKVRPPFRYTAVAPDGIKFVPLDMSRELTPAQILQEHPKGIEYAHILREFDRYPLIVDSNGDVLSMPPIINGELTRVTEGTNRLFIDVTGTDELAVNQALTILMTGFAERGFKLRSIVVRYPNRRIRVPNLRATRTRLNVRGANETIGLDLKPREAAEIMKRMRFGIVGKKGDNLTLLVPPYRTDVMHEVDLIEDLAVGYGYDKLKPASPRVVTVGERHPLEALSDMVRRALTGLGFMEVMTFTLTNPRTNFELMRAGGTAATIANPVSEEYTILRTWLLPSLMSVLKANRPHPLPQRVFEVGDLVLLDEDAETGARNVRRVAAAVIGDLGNFTYIKAVTEAVLRDLGIAHEIRPLDHPSFLEGRAAEVAADGRCLGMIGELHPEVILNFELGHPVAAFELDLPMG